MSRDQPDPERLIDEMAVALCSLLRIEDEAHCILALMEHGFRAAEITAHFDEALALARMARADGWHEIVQQVSDRDGWLVDVKTGRLLGPDPQIERELTNAELERSRRHV